MEKTYQDIINKYPQLFERASLSETESCMGRGIECGIGWYSLIDKMCYDLEQLFVGIPYSNYPKIEQVKEKFGSLRVYIDFFDSSLHLSDKAYGIIYQAEHDSSKICETCGEPGSVIQKSGWIYCACEKHRS
jgi:hypothetical protein